MHAQWSKEWRLLRPGLVAAVGLAILPLVFQLSQESRRVVSMLLTFCMFLAGVLIGIEAFRREFHQQTLTLWLALPMSRAGLRRSKVRMARLSIVGVVLLNWMLLFASAPFRGYLPNFEAVLRPAIAMHGGTALGLFWSVRLRQTCRWVSAPNRPATPVSDGSASSWAKPPI